MKKAVMLFSFILFTSIAFANPPGDQFQYSIVFGSCFKNETVSLKINNSLIIANHPVFKNNKERKGNLGLTQTDKGLTIFYNGEQKTKSKVKFDFILNLDIAVNGKWSNYKIDLRKGKVLLFDLCSDEDKSNTLSFEQIQEPVLLM